MYNNIDDIDNIENVNNPNVVNAEEEEENIISSSINRPDYEKFEKDKSRAQYEMNKKHNILIKNKQSISGEIDSFNAQMNNLLELVKCHKHPFNLNDIKIMMTDIGGGEIDEEEDEEDGEERDGGGGERDCSTSTLPATHRSIVLERA